MKYHSLFFFIVCMIGCSTLEQKQKLINYSITSPISVRHNGRNATLNVIVAEGERVSSKDYGKGGAYCMGQCQVIEGTFLLRLMYDNGSVVESNLNELTKSTDGMWFCGTGWKLIVQDYRHDGSVCFNVGQYGTSNGWMYWLFAIDDTGKAKLLRIPPDDFIFLNDYTNSTERILSTPDGISYESFVNDCDEAKDCGMWRTTIKWDPQSDSFVEVRNEHE